MDTRTRQQQRLGDRKVGQDKNYGTSDSGQPLNPQFRTRSAAHDGRAWVDPASHSPEAERVLRLWFPNSPHSKGRR